LILAQRVIVVSGDVLPLPGYPTSGAGLRAWGLGQGLRAHNFDVTFAMPAASWRADASLPPADKPLLWDHFNLESLLRDAKPDAVVFQHWPCVLLRERLDVPTIIDFHGPHILERAFQKFGDVSTNLAAKIGAIRKADFYTCAGEKQKGYFLTWLLLGGIDLSQERICVVPVGLEPDLPIPSPDPNAINFVYGGVYLPWQNPTLALNIVAEVLTERGKGTLRLFGGRHPVIPAEVLPVPPLFAELEKHLAGNPHVRFEGMRPRDELIETYRRATVAVDLMAHNYERELAFTTRTVEYMWCGLPVIYNDYADLSALIRQFDAGWALDPNDPVALRRVVEEILDDPRRARQRGQNAQRLVRERLTWDRTIKPLADFLRAPRMQTTLAPDLIAITTTLQTGALAPAPRSWRRIARAAWQHYRQGGFWQLARAAVGFLRRRLVK